LLDATLSREAVLDVLKQFGISVIALEEGRFSIGRDGDVPEIHRLPPTVGRRMIGYLAHTFGIATHLFWHPEQIAEWKAARAASSHRADPN
jgi:hypothetical protein